MRVERRRQISSRTLVASGGVGPQGFKAAGPGRGCRAKETAVIAICDRCLSLSRDAARRCRHTALGQIGVACLISDARTDIDASSGLPGLTVAKAVPAGIVRRHPPAARFRSDNRRAVVMCTFPARCQRLVGDVIRLGSDRLGTRRRRNMRLQLWLQCSGGNRGAPLDIQEHGLNLFELEIWR